MSDSVALLSTVASQVQPSSPLGAWCRALAQLGDGDPSIDAETVRSLGQRAASQVQLSSPLGQLLLGSIRSPQHVASQIGAGPLREWIYSTLIT